MMNIVLLIETMYSLVKMRSKLSSNNILTFKTASTKVVCFSHLHVSKEVNSGHPDQV